MRVRRFSTRVGKTIVSEDPADVSWYHKPILEQKVREAERAYIRAIIGEFNETQTHTIGFKEIRHWNKTELDEFTRVFPGARFIFSTREDFAVQSQSHSRYL